MKFNIDKYLDNRYLKIISPILVIIIFFVALIGAFTFLKPTGPEELLDDTKKKQISDIPFENRTGIKEVRKFSDLRKNMRNQSLYNISGKTSRSISRPARTPKPLPYPRIEINFAQERTGTIGGESAGNGYIFAIIKMDIRNYGYKYFDAHPAKFGMMTRDGLIDPLVNVSTPNIIDAVIPNNSRAKGDIIFLIKSRQSVIKNIKYKSENYKILFKSVSSIEDKIIEDETEEDEECDNGYDYYEGDKCNN